ncbi:NADPH dehydrogenase [Polystyrenella longa]|uniref:NADPH dehydrogenase n=1 Tax=Polystyrenella longa TaxID=2528007 RepID=A0A518CQX8_9PLAN|nr:NADH:flavin oxidoreductase [Polystyrenella longa]QDU81618.1 NADPH dehydrogenase [Polystyrenella longa]
MARYYKYKSAEQVVEGAQELGQKIYASDDFSPLFEPISLDGMLVGNRLGIQPMEGCDGTQEGFPDELTYRRYQRFGAGGAKLIWGEATAIADDGRMNPRQLMINEKTASALEDMLTGCRDAHQEAFGSTEGLAVGLQLTHSGRFSYRKPLIATRDPILDKVTIDKSTGKPIDDSYPILTDDELKQIEDQYVAAAGLAYKIGVDFIDLKQCHKYLLSELLGATNRPGEYGGSLENRTRLIRNLVKRIKEEYPDLIIASRMNAYDGIPYRGEGEEFIGVPQPHKLPLLVAFGTNPNNHLEEDLAEPIQVAKWLREWGVSLLNISCGNPYANPHLVRPAEFPPVDGYHAPEHPLLGVCRHIRIVREIHQAVPDLPIMGSGYSWLQDFAMHVGAANVARNDVSIVGMGRATLSHPDFAKTLLEEGKMTRKKICRTFSYCTNLMRTKDHPLGQYPTGCPPFDKEVYDPIWKEAQEVRKAKEAK